MFEILVVLSPDWDQVVGDSDDGEPVTMRSDEAIDAFAAELQRGTPSGVVRVVGDVDLGAADDAFLIGDRELLDRVAQEPPEAAREILRRTVFLNMEPSATPGVLEELGVVAAIESRRYFEWRTQPEREYGGGIYGRKAVVDGIGGSWHPSRVWETEHYCCFFHDDLPTLPSALARYLDGYRSIVLEGRPRRERPE